MVIENIDPLMVVELPFGWELIPLGKCVTEKLSYGINAPAIPYSSSHPCYIRITDITEDGQYDNENRKSVKTQEIEKYSLKSGNIVLARTGASTGKSYLYNQKDGELVYAGFLIKAAIDLQCHNPRFIVGQLRTKRYWTWVAATSMRSGQPGINGKEYSSFLIPVAPKSEQDAIAEIFLTFDTYIDDLAELIGKKRDIRNGALEDLVSGRTRMEGFEGEWTVCKIGSILKIFHGKNQRSVECYNGKYPILGTGGVIGKTNDYLCDWECVLIGRKGTIDKPIYMNTPFWTIDTLYYSKPEVQQCVKFQYYLFCTIDWYDYSESSGRPSLARKVIENIPIRIPLYEEQKAIASILTAMDEEIEALEAERDKMIQIREGAMDDLLTGRVRLTV